MTRFLSALGRHRRVVLVLGLAAAVAYLTVGVRAPDLARRAVPALVLAMLCVLAAAVAVSALWRHRAFEVRPRVPAFSAPPHPATALHALVTLLATQVAGFLVRDLATSDLTGWAVTVLTGFAAVPGFVGAWRGGGIELRPDGLRDREWAGVLVVPWDALPAVPPPGATDGRGTLPVRYGRPELVRRRGLVTGRHRLGTANVDQQVAARAIRHYTTHPEHRPAIGTRAEYDRLLSEITDPPPSPAGPRP